MCKSVKPFSICSVPSPKRRTSEKQRVVSGAQSFVLPTPGVQTNSSLQRHDKASPPKVKTKVKKAARELVELLATTYDLELNIAEYHPCRPGM